MGGEWIRSNEGPKSAFTDSEQMMPPKYGWNGPSLEASRDAVNARPGDPQARSDLADALLVDGDPDGAFVEYHEVLRLTSEDHGLRGHAHLFLADICMAKRQFPEAIVEFRNALKYRPDHPSANLFLGDLLQHEGRTEEARTHWQRVVDRFGEDSTLYQAVEAQKRLKTYGA